MAEPFDPRTTCYIKRMPVLCSGAAIADSSALPYPSAYIPEAAALYNIGKLRTEMPTYDPTNQQLAEYGFSAQDVVEAWVPTVYYCVSGGSITNVSSGGILPISGGQVEADVCTSDGYNTKRDNYVIVTYYPVAKSGATITSITFGAGGGCYISGGIVTSQVTGSAGPGITAPAAIVRTFAQTTALGATGTSPAAGGGSSGGSGGTTCDVFIGVVTQAPTNGIGAGKVQKVTFNSDGSWSAAGGSMTVIFPRI